MSVFRRNGGGDGARPTDRPQLCSVQAIIKSELVWSVLSELTRSRQRANDAIVTWSEMTRGRRRRRRKKENGSRMRRPAAVDQSIVRCMYHPVERVFYLSSLFRLIFDSPAVFCPLVGHTKRKPSDRWWKSHLASCRRCRQQFQRTQQEKNKKKNKRIEKINPHDRKSIAFTDASFPTSPFLSFPEGVSR